MDAQAQRAHAEVDEVHWWFVGRRRVLESVTRALGLPAGARLVELGAGTGGNLAWLSRFGEVTAVEPSDEGRALSAARAPFAAHVPSLEALPHARYDAAFVLDVLEHVEDPVATLRALGARLLPGAPLVVTVPAHPWMFGEHDAALSHRRRYRADGLAADLTAGGFTVAWMSPMNCALFPVAVGARLVEAARTLLRPRAPELRGMTVPPAPLNRLLAELFAAERWLLPRRLPLGLSLVAVARRSD